VIPGMTKLNVLFLGERDVGQVEQRSYEIAG
jgi:hypothetical protein